MIYSDSLGHADEQYRTCAGTRPTPGFQNMIDSIVTQDPMSLNAEELFGRLPANRVGDAEKRYVDELYEAGFGNFEPADMLGRFEAAFAEKFGRAYGISFNSGSGTLLASMMAAGVGPGAVGSGGCGGAAGGRGLRWCAGACSRPPGRFLRARPTAGTGCRPALPAPLASAVQWSAAGRPSSGRTGHRCAQQITVAHEAGRRGTRALAR